MGFRVRDCFDEFVTEYIGNVVKRSIADVAHPRVIDVGGEVIVVGITVRAALPGRLRGALRHKHHVEDATAVVVRLGKLVVVDEVPH